ncbi:MAG: c-type cytochrome biogenesis protein CcsB [Chitinispirillia bacterium]|jgi:cytochrome c-type biogenesis protein CcsB
MDFASDVTFFWLSLVIYSVSCLFYLVFLATEQSQISRIASYIALTAFILQTLAMTMRSIQSGHLPLTNMFEFISVFAWFAAIFYFIALKLFKNDIIGPFILPIIFMLLVSASLLPKDKSMQLVPALQSYWLQIHVSLAASAEAAFLIAFAANIMYFLKKYISEKSSFAKRLPELEKLDYYSYKAITVGFPLFTVGALFAGAIWAEQAWGIFWSWDPKEVCSLVVWLIYSAYLHARFVKGWKGTRAAVLSVIGFICTILTVFSNMVLGGLHAYG